MKHNNIVTNTPRRKREGQYKIVGEFEARWFPEDARSTEADTFYVTNTPMRSGLQVLLKLQEPNLQHPGEKDSSSAYPIELPKKTSGQCLQCDTDIVNNFPIMILMVTS